MIRFLALFGLAGYASALFCNETADCLRKPDTRQMTRVMRLIQASRDKCIAEGQCPKHIPSSQGIANEKQCTNGAAGEYPCSNVDLLSFTNLEDLGSSSSANGNDIWGWKDASGKLYAITGQTDGASVVDVTDGANVNVLGFLPSKISRNVVWRDLKVMKDYAFVVADGSGHGMQVLDLNRVAKQGKLMKQTNPGAVPQLTEDAYYQEFSNCHNIFVNEDSGFLYAVGTNTCAGGLHVVDVNDPLKPTFAGCFADDGYTHDIQCVNYKGPDSRYTGREICFAFNEDTLTLVDVTDKNDMKMLSREGYDGVEYCHQGWLTADQGYLLVDDELDEVYDSNGAGGKTETYVWDVTDLEKPKLTKTYFAKHKAVDHNLYIVGNLAYETNYEAGLRILDVSDISKSSGSLTEVGYFDVYPEGDEVDFLGSWSSYPFWVKETNGELSGHLVVQSIDRGLFVLKPNLSGHARKNVTSEA